jgi:hypothetical protein
VFILSHRAGPAEAWRDNFHEFSFHMTPLVAQDSFSLDTPVHGMKL